MGTNTTEVYNDERSNLVAYFLLFTAGFILPGVQNVYVKRNALALVEFVLFVLVLICSHYGYYPWLEGFENIGLTEYLALSSITFASIFHPTFILIDILGLLWLFDLFTLHIAVRRINKYMEQTGTLIVRA